MAYKDIEDKRAYHRMYREKHKARLNKHERTRYLQNKEYQERRKRFAGVSHKRAKDRKDQAFQLRRPQLGMVIEARRAVVKVITATGEIISARAIVSPGVAKAFGTRALGIDDLVRLRPNKKTKQTRHLHGARFCYHFKQGEIPAVQAVQAAHFAYLHNAPAPLGFDLFLARALGKVHDNERENLQEASRLRMQTVKT